MRIKVLLFPLFFLLTACTFQVEVLGTATPQPSQAVLPFASATAVLTPDVSATPPVLPTFNSLNLPTPFATAPAQPEDIQFAPDATWQEIRDGLNMGDSKTYALYALQGQVMSVSVFLPDEQAVPFQMEIKGQDGTVLCATVQYGCPFWRGVLPSSQRYFITLTASVPSSYRLRVVINPPGSANQTFMYADPQGRFSLSYPDEFAPAAHFQAQVYKFPPQVLLQYIDTQQFINTNLGEAYFMLGASADPQDVSTCTQTLSFGGPETIVGEVTINGVPFTKSQVVSAGAGNLYEQTYYRTAYNGTCYEVTDYVHYLNIGNFATGSVREFDHEALLQKFDEIRQTLVLK